MLWDRDSSTHMLCTLDTSWFPKHSQEWPPSTELRVAPQNTTCVAQYVASKNKKISHMLYLLTLSYKDFFLNFCLFLEALSVILLALYSGIVPGWLQEPYGDMLGIEPASAICKAKALPPCCAIPLAPSIPCMSSPKSGGGRWKGQH